MIRSTTGHKALIVNWAKVSSGACACWSHCLHWLKNPTLSLILEAMSFSTGKLVGLPVRDQFCMGGPYLRVCERRTRVIAANSFPIQVQQSFVQKRSCMLLSRHAAQISASLQPCLADLAPSRSPISLSSTCPSTGSWAGTWAGVASKGLF